MKPRFSKRTLLSVCLAIGVSTVCAAPPSGGGLCRYVDPFIGTQGEGNTFPGASLPFGMVKLGPDCGDLQGNAGYRHDGGVKGFSHTHVSGTGGGCKYGNILVAPFTTTEPDFGAQLIRNSESARPGFFSMNLAAPDGGDIVAEMTVTPHAALHRYVFHDTRNKGMLIEAGSLLGRYYGCGEAQNLIGSEVEFISPTEIAGYCRLDGGWNMGDAFTIYFYAAVDRTPVVRGTWIEGEGVRSDTEYAIGEGRLAGAWLSFGSELPDTISLKVGVSYISVAKARENVRDEVGEKDLDLIAREAQDVWESYLQRVEVESDDPEELTKFYTALYHTLLQPTDKTGENSRWHSDAPYFDDFYCLWDTFRTNHPLYTLIAPEQEARIVNSLIDIYRHEGFMPDGRSGDSNGRSQGGSNADMIVAEAILKELDGIDAEGALEAMLRDAEVDPGAAARRHGRGGISDYKRLGYVSTDYERSGVRTLEYAANDMAISLAAEKLGQHDLAEKYAVRAANWRNLWKDVTFDGIRGFIMPRKADGQWDETFCDPTWDYYVSTPDYKLGITPYNEIPDSGRRDEVFTPRSHGSWVNIFYESNSWEYSLYVPHDVAGLIEMCGGRGKFTERLDHFFDNNHYNINNEPGFLVPCLYIFAGGHDKSMERINDILRSHYSAAPDGLPGNDDSGSMSSWLVFHKTGLFPMAGQDVYLITSPHFSSAKVRMSPEHTVEIKARGISPENIYVKQLKIDGNPWRRPWITHSELQQAITLEFTMGSNAAGWFSGELPPSHSPENKMSSGK